MFRVIAHVVAIALGLALAAPTLAVAQQNNGHRPPPGRGGPRPAIQPHGPPPGAFRGPPPGAFHGQPGAFRGPPRGGPGIQFSYHGRGFNPVHISPFAYPSGWAYRRWAVGAVLPPIFLTPDYYYTDYAGLGLDPPPPGTQWVRYGPDLLLVDVSTGQVLETVYGVFY
jgi:hypothetical protein